MKRNLLYLLLIFLTIGCSDNEPDVPETVPAERTILIYMAANNSLGRNQLDNDGTLKRPDSLDIDEIRRAAAAGAIGSANRLMLFHAPVKGDNTLYEVLSDGTLEVVTDYGKTDYATYSDFMLRVFNDARLHAPAADYGLIMWSHAMGWTQNGTVDNGPTLSTETWGEDRGRTMNITTLKRVLGACRWSWVYFDCCYMGSVEVAYELAPVLDRMVASASEVPLDGMPYEKNLTLLFRKEADLEGAARNTFDYYNSLDGVSRTVTISVLDLRYMDELAQNTARIYQLSDIFAVNDFTNLPLTLSVPALFYDFGTYVDGLCAVNNLTDDIFSNWQLSMNKVVRYYANTPYLWKEISLDGFSGLSTYLPINENYIDRNNYTSLEWYRDVARFLYGK